MNLETIQTESFDTVHATRLLAAEVTLIRQRMYELEQRVTQLEKQTRGVRHPDPAPTQPPQENP